MTKEELEKVVQGAEYDFLRENPHLGSNIMFLTLGGSHAYGTNVPGSDVDVRGVTGDSKYDLLGFGTFEQVVEQSTDTTIYGFRKLVSLLINCNPNAIEMLGSKPDNYLMVSPEGQMLLDNKALFLSKKALYSFGGYANDQLRRLQMGLLQNDVNTDMKEEFALRSVQRVLSGPDLQHNAPAEAENHFNISMQEGMNLDKYYEMLTKYINGGCGNKVPYLGIAMDPMNFKLINSDDIKPTQPFNEDLGFMPFTEDYTKPKDPDLVCRHLTIENGIIDFTKGEYFHCYEGLT